MQVNIKLAVLLLLFSLVHTNVTTKTGNYETMVTKKSTFYVFNIYQYFTRQVSSYSEILLKMTSATMIQITTINL